MHYLYKADLLSVFKFSLKVLILVLTFLISIALLLVIPVGFYYLASEPKGFAAFCGAGFFFIEVAFLSYKISFWS